MQGAAISSHTLSDQQASSVNAFVENFYRLTDDPGAHLEYASQFLPSAKLIVNHKVARGQEGIVSLRKRVWSPFLSQKHTIESIAYTQKPSTRIENKDYTMVEAILFGTVTTASKTGELQTVEWAGRAQYVSKNDIEWNILRYQVYLNTKPRSVSKL